VNGILLEHESGEHTSTASNFLIYHDFTFQHIFFDSNSLVCAILQAYTLICANTYHNGPS
jgi:hypothetical protein